MTDDPIGRQLILLRHAKSDWGNDRLSDHDRPLNRRGQTNTPRMAQWIADKALAPNLVLCSTAVRAQETLSGLREYWAANAVSSPEVIDCPELYLATAETILDVVERNGGHAERVMVVGHNPGISHLASLLARQSVEMPTAALAAYDFADTDWESLQSASMPTFSHFMKPKALPK